MRLINYVFTSCSQKYNNNENIHVYNTLEIVVVNGITIIMMIEKMNFMSAKDTSDQSNFSTT